MYIEFNISLNGRHFFATHERSCTDSSKAEELKRVLLFKFPESQGYKVTASITPQRSYGLDLSNDTAWEVNNVLTNK
jgi:hypothetical protein